MAKDVKEPKAAEKGKGKAVEEPKEEKPAANGKEDDKKKDADKKDCTCCLNLAASGSGTCCKQ